MSWFITESLGQTQKLTPEGFLLCLDVPVARTGSLLYAPGEVPVEPGPDGIIRIARGPEDLFRPETIASFQGKTITNEHPEDMVSPQNWKEVSIGHMQNVRPGVGIHADELMADFLICDPESIQDIRAGKRQISLGYDAAYVQDKPGYGRQADIIGNHGALVDSGRCGARCAIGDRLGVNFYEDEEAASWSERMAIAVRTKDFKTCDALMKELNPGKVCDDTLPSPSDPNTATAAVAPPAGDIPGPHRIIVNVHGGAKADDASAGAATPSGVSPDPSTAQGNQQAAATGGTPFEQQVATAHQQIIGLLQQVLTALGGEGSDTDEEDVDAPDGGDSVPPQRDGSGGGEEEETGDEEPDLTGDDPTEDEQAAFVQKPMKTPGTKDGKAVKKPGTAQNTRDSSGLVTRAQDVISRAEILAPGISVFAFNPKVPAAKTLDMIARLQRRALSAAMDDATSKAAVTPFLNGRKPIFATMDSSRLNTLFMGASELMRNTTGKAFAGKTGATSDRKGPLTLAEMNKRNAEFWANQNK